MAANAPELVAPCGMNCALCAGYLALKNNVKTKGIRMPTCAGCRPRGKQCAYLKKQTASCSKLMNERESFCFDCAEFPCPRLKTIDARYRSRYHLSFIENLGFIKENGMKKFLEDQEEKWKCQKCGGMISCHNGLCFNCDVEKLRAKKQKYRWENDEEAH